MTTVLANGQFGPDQFAVLSRNLVVVDAKWLTDSAGSSYIIDQNTGRPYIVPRNYDPSITAAYFADKLSTAQAIDNSLGMGPGISSITSAIYPELYNAFKQGGWGDLQRPLADKTDVVDAFVPAASFNLGIASAAGGVSALEAIFFGGVYNVRTNGIWNLYNNPQGFGNNPDNPQHIQDGSDQFGRGTVGVRYVENSTTSPDGRQTATNIDTNGDGHADLLLTTIRMADGSNTQDIKYLGLDGTSRAETSTISNATATEATTRTDANGDGLWDTETVALATGRVETNNVFDANASLRTQQVFLGDGSIVLKEYDTRNTHPYTELDIDEDATGKVTAAQLKIASGNASDAANLRWGDLKGRIADDMSEDKATEDRRLVRDAFAKSLKESIPER